MSTLFCVLTRLGISVLLLIVSLELISNGVFISVIFGIVLDIIALILLFTDPDDIIRWISRKLN